MADIRIKDLTTTASSTASDDFFAADGTTNGTRKLSAYSPTFGGNATVGGTLTVAALVTANGGANVVTSGFTQTQTGNELRFSRNGFNYVAMDGGTSANIRFLGTTTTAGDTGILNLANTQVAVLPTTASTTTSSGALVVGNGTSGGLGVGGAITLGGRLNAFGTAAALTHQVYVYNQLASATNAALSGAQYLAQPGYSTFVGTTGNGTNASYQGSIIGSAVVSEQGYVISDAVRGLLLHGVNGGIKFATNNPGTQAGSISNAGVWTIDTATDSTTKSDGALVVSGGVGVEKNIIAGSGIAARGTLTLPAAWTGSYGIGLEHNNATATSRIFFGDGTGYTLKFASRSSSTTTDRMTLTDTGNLTLAGTLTATRQITSTDTSQANDTSQAYFQAIAGNDATLGGLVVTLGARPSATGANRYAFIGSGDNGAMRPLSLCDNGSGAYGQVLVRSSSASTGTSSGALVVSGGVGVAGAVNVGTYLKLSNASQNIAAWGDVGPQFSISGSVLTDTTSSGTVPRAVVNSIASTAIAASSTTTYTQAATLFIAAAPTANTNVTITHGYALYTAGGRINFQGLPTSSAGLQAGTLWNDGGTLKVA